MEDEFNDDEIDDEDGRPKYRLGHVPPKSNDMRQQVCKK